MPGHSPTCDLLPARSITITMDPTRESLLQRILPRGYNTDVEKARSSEYPQLNGTRTSISSTPECHR